MLTVLVAEHCRSVQKNHDFSTPVFTFYVYFCKTFLHHLVVWTNFWSSRWSKPQQMQRNHWRSAGVWIRLMKKCEGRLSFVLERGIFVSWVLFYINYFFVQDFLCYQLRPMSLCFFVICKLLQKNLNTKCMPKYFN